MDRMPPPGSGHPGMTVVIAAHPADKDGKMPPPGMDAIGNGGKVPPEEAGVHRSDETCSNCTMWDPTSGECSKVTGNFDPSDGCLEYFDPIGSDEPEDQGNGAPNDDEETGS